MQPHLQCYRSIEGDDGTFTLRVVTKEMKLFLAAKKTLSRSVPRVETRAKMTRRWWGP